MTEPQRAIQIEIAFPDKIERKTLEQGSLDRVIRKGM